MTASDMQRIQYTPVIKRLMEELCIPIAPDLKEKTLLNILLFHIATIAGYYRIHQGEREKRIINHYALVIAHSCYGKDRTKCYITEHLLKNFYDKFVREANDYTESVKNKNIAESLEKYPKIMDGKRDVNTKDRQDYLKSLPEPRTILPFQSIRSSTQGLDADAKFLSKAAKFSINSFENEFSSYFKNASDLEKKIIEVYVALYDGTFTTGSFKSEAKKEEIKDIFCNILLFAQPSFLIKKNVKTEIKEILTNGLGRRCFISLDDIQISDDDEYIDFNHYITHCENVLSPLMDDIVQKLENNTKKIVTISNVALNIIKNYYEANRKEIRRINKYADDVVISDLQGRHDKATRLAALITCIEDPKNLIISEEIIGFAKQLTEIYSNDLINYLITKSKDETDEILNKFMENKNEWFSKTDIREWKILDKKLFTAILKDEIESVKNKANRLGMDIITRQTSSTGLDFKLVDLQQEELEKSSRDAELLQKMDNSGVQTLDYKFIMSYSMDNSTVINDISIPTKNYQCVEFDMPDLKTLLEVSFRMEFGSRVPLHWTVAYSPFEYYDGYRKSSNVIGEPEVIILDFDDGLTLEESHQKFKPFLNAIATTRSHQKLKNGVVCDRFRVIMPTYPIPKDKYKKVMGNILRYYSSDEQCKDCARLFFASHNSEVTLNEGMLFDWKVFEDLYPPVIRAITESDISSTNHWINDPNYAANVYKKCGADFSTGKRNSSFFTVCSLLKKEIDNGNITEEQAEAEANRCYDDLIPDKTGFEIEEAEDIMERTIFSSL